MALRDHLDKLHAFSTICRAGSITAAAKELAISQTALSHSLKVLEEVLGVSLLSRGRTGVTLTEAGQRLYEYSQRLLLEIDSLEKALNIPHDAHVGKLRVGTHETLAIHLWPAFLENFSRQFPEIQISLISGRIDALVSGVLNHEYHLIVTVEPTADPRLNREVLFRDRLSFFASASDGGKAQLTIDEARALPILTDSQAHVEQRLPIPQLLLQHGFQEAERFELNSFEAAIRLAEKGVGLALLPERNARAAVEAKRLRQVEVKGLHRSFGHYALCSSCPEKNRGDFLTALLRKELASFLSV